MPNVRFCRSRSPMAALEQGRPTIVLGHREGRSDTALAGEFGLRKKFSPETRRSADNPLISPDPPPRMEGIGSDFRRFGSSWTRPGGAPDASLKSLGARLEAYAGFRRGVLRQCPREWSVGLEMAPQRLEEIDSAPGNGMASGASKPQDLAQWRVAAAVPAVSRLRQRGTEIAPKPLQSLARGQNCAAAQNSGAGLPLNPVASR